MSEADSPTPSGKTEQAPVSQTEPEDESEGGPEDKTHPEAIAQEIFRSASGPRLFSYLFDGDFHRLSSISSVSLDAIRWRLNTAYPDDEAIKHGSARDNEILSRVGILKALGQKLQTDRRQRYERELRLLFQEIIAKDEESFLVQRQALRNLASLGASLGEKEKSQYLGELDPQLMAAAALDDQELLEAILENSY